ncbi:TolC family protein [Ghiorsea bivora]|uniref:TolC family protein n=1 Tax=Ghiorsea bivora TaxID=1485545 RepID=UPI00068F7CF4|nr:TolC family protein [Ghiorsea bivora]
MSSFPFKVSPLIVGSLSLIFSSLAIAEEPLTLEKAVMQVKENPAYLARKASASAWSFIPEQAGGLPDPVLSLGALNFPTDTFARDQENMTQLQVGISQALPFPGKLELREKFALYMAKAAADDVDELRLQLVSQAKVNWWNLYYLDRALEIVVRNQELLRQFVRIAETKYTVGEGLQQDVLLAQLELSQLIDRQIQLKAIRSQEQSRLNALLNRPISQEVVLPEKVEEMLPGIGSEELLMNQALASRPLLAQQQQYIQAAEANTNLAEKDYYPDFKVGASYGLRDTNPITGLNRADLGSITLSMTLPFFTSNQQDAQLEQRQAERMKAEFSYQDVQEKVQAEVRIEIAAYEKAKQQVSLYKQGIIPQATQTVASMLAAYQVNKVDFLNLVRTQVTLYNYETQYWKVLAEANQSLARLDAATGRMEQ